MGNNISSPYMPTSNNVTVPVEMKSDLGMFCLSLRTSNKIELIHAPAVVADCVRNVVNEVNRKKKTSKHKLGAMQFKLYDGLFSFGNVGQLFCIHLLEELHKIGYDLEISSELARYSSVTWEGPTSTAGTLFFRKVTSERPAAKVVCVDPDWKVLVDHRNTGRLVGGININGGKTDSFFFIKDSIPDNGQLRSIILCHKNRLRLVNCKEESKSIRQAITKSGFRIQDESENEHQVNMQLYGRPWHCSGAEGVRSRQLVATTGLGAH